MGSMAYAQTPTEGVITLTGPGSNNTFTDNQSNTFTFTCNNTVPVTTTNTQTSASGNGTVSVNTNGGVASTGSAFNVNGTNVTVGVTGCSCSEAIFNPAAVCPAAPVVAGPAVAAAAAPEQPGGGGGAGELPNTASSPAAAIIVTSLAATAGTVGLSRMIVTTYRRFNK